MSLKPLPAFLLALFLFSAALLRAAETAPVRIGPELEVQRRYAARVLPNIDWARAERRWELFIRVISPDPPEGPSEDILAIRRRAAPDLATWLKTREDILLKIKLQAQQRADWGLDLNPFLISGDPRLMKSWITQARHSPDAALAAGAFFDELAKRLKGPEPATLFSWIPQAGLATTLIKPDHTVFEFTHPTFSSVAEMRSWTNRIASNLGIPREEVPALALNPHFHLSRSFEEPVTEKMAGALTRDLQLAAALTTIQHHTENHPTLKPSKPFYGGMNSVNFMDVSDQAYTLRGNVRYIPSELPGSTEFRFEFRSLGGMSPEQTDAFLEKMRAMLERSLTAEEYQQHLRQEIAERFAAIDERKLAHAIVHSVDGAFHTPPESILQSVNKARSEIGVALTRTYGARQAEAIMAAKWGRVLEHLDLTDMAQCLKNRLRPKK